MEFNKFVPKNWGYELWVVNSEKYCGKLLFFRKDKRCSIHFHKLKTETFYITSGMIEVWWDDRTEFLSSGFEKNKEVLLKDDLYRTYFNKTILKAGEYFHIPAGRVHQVVALEDSLITEFSTQHFEEDSYRLLKGD
jgi:quercetin dioxygenase-like cupin family protein